MSGYGHGFRGAERDQIDGVAAGQVQPTAQPKPKLRTAGLRSSRGSAFLSAETGGQSGAKRGVFCAGEPSAAGGGRKQAANPWGSPQDGWIVYKRRFIDYE